MHAICNTPVLHAIYRVLRTRNLQTYMNTVAMSIALVTTVHTCGFLCINLVVVQKLL